MMVQWERVYINGYEAAVLPLVNIKIPYGSAVLKKIKRIKY